MYYTLKKLGVTFILLNIFTFQSLMADMMFYYSAAILPSIVASQQQAHTAPIANHDEATSSELVPVTVDVLENDTIDAGLTVTVRLGEYDNYANLSYSDAAVISVEEGTWTIEANQSVTFAPSPTYGGGGVHRWYQITDYDGHSSVNDIYIDYPVLLQGQAISISETNTSLIMTIDVLSGITIASDENVSSLLLQNGWDDVTNEPTYGIDAQLDVGNWSVVNNEVVFTPSPNFSGGTVSIEYQITDTAGRVATEYVEIIYPTYIIAMDDEVSPLVVVPVTVDVLDNDTIAAGLKVTVQLIERWDGNIPVYADVIDYNDGTWSVEENQSVTFTPSPDFTGGDLYMGYGITDQYGHTSTTIIILRYPISIQANNDIIDVADIVQVSVDVFANDVLESGATLQSLLLQTGWDNMTNSPIYGTFLENEEGNWSVVGGEVVFTPINSFSGGSVSVWYQITDNQDRTASTEVRITYPLFLQSVADSRITVDITHATTVDVLTNDFISDDVTLSEVLLSQFDYNTQQASVGSQVTTDQGIWTIVNDEVVFTPDTAFTGGTIYMNYIITDDQGHATPHYQGSIAIQYPLVATPICTSTIVSDLSALYNLAVSSTEDDDEQHYIFADELFTNTEALPILNPMYFEANYEEQGTDYVELRTAKITFFENNNTWTYNGQKIVNDHGVKNIESESDSGDYSIEVDGSYLLIMNGESVFNPKAVQEIVLSDLVNMFPALTLTADDTAQIILTKATGNRYWWDDGYTHTEMEPAYANFNEYILTREYNSSNEGYANVMLYTPSEAGITFAAGSSEVDSGTLVEINRELNELLTETAGTWSIETITDEGNEYDILILEPILCGYRKTIYKLGTDGNIYRGGQEETLNEIGAEIIFNESFNNKMETYFIENAPLDINASTGI